MYVRNGGFSEARTRDDPAGLADRQCL